MGIIENHMDFPLNSENHMGTIENQLLLHLRDRCRAPTRIGKWVLMVKGMAVGKFITFETFTIGGYT